MSTITASNITLDVTQQQVKQFFSFCGKINDIRLEPGTTHQTAHVTFERASAAKTALLLQDAVLGRDKIKISSEDHSVDDRDHTEHHGDGDVAQEHKPRTTIVAEYLSHGYVLGDSALQKSMDFDKQHGLSGVFLTYLQAAGQKAQQLDQQYHVSEKAQQLDQQYKVSDKVQEQTSVLSRYFESALDATAAGQVIRKFYTGAVHSVLDIHSEARRLADLRTGGNPGAELLSHLKQTSTVSGTGAQEPSSAGTGGKGLQQISGPYQPGSLLHESSAMGAATAGSGSAVPLPLGQAPSFGGSALGDLRLGSEVPLGGTAGSQEIHASTGRDAATLIPADVKTTTI